MDIANSIIAQTTEQINLLLSLSTAICGAIMAFILQISLHNNTSEEKAIRLRGTNWLIVAFLIEGVSILFGYFAQGTLISLTPAIYKASNPNIKNWTTVQFPGSVMIRATTLLQFLFFFLGLLTVISVIFRNRKIMDAKRTIKPVSWDLSNRP